jgi:Zn-dependent M32 family carboxypeptidase
MSEIERLAQRLVTEIPRRQALEHLNEVLTWDADTPIGSDEFHAHAAYNVALVTAVRRYCEDTKRLPPWS